MLVGESNWSRLVKSVVKAVKKNWLMFDAAKRLIFRRYWYLALLVFFVSIVVPVYNSWDQIAAITAWCFSVAVRAFTTAQTLVTDEPSAYLLFLLIVGIAFFYKRADRKLTSALSKRLTTLEECHKNVTRRVDFVEDEFDKLLSALLFRDLQPKIISLSDRIKRQYLETDYARRPGQFGKDQPITLIKNSEKQLERAIDDLHRAMAHFKLELKWRNDTQYIPLIHNNGQVHGINDPFLKAGFEAFLMKYHDLQANLSLAKTTVDEFLSQIAKQ